MSNCVMSFSGCVCAPDAKAPGAVPSLYECGLFDNLGDLLGMDDERSMAAGDLRRLRLDSGCKRLLRLGGEDFVLGADDIEGRLVMPGRNVDGGFERNVIQRKLRVGEVLGDLRRKVSRDGRRKHFRIDVQIALRVRM